MSLSQSFSQKIGNVRPLNPCPSLDIDFANGGYVNTGGFANQESVGSANFKIGAFNGPDPIFTRSTAATFRGSNGLIQYAPENLLGYSEEFNNTSAWTTFATTVSPNAATAPNGTITADALIESSGVEAHIIFTTFSTEIGRAYNISVYIKANGRNFALLRAADNTMPSVLDVISVDLINGTAVSALGSPNNISCVPAANGFFRVSFSFTPVSSSTRISIIASTDGVYANRLYNGDITKGIYIWGAQLERSSTARPYISTTALPVHGPRFEYDLNGNPLGLLMEEQSQNLVYPSSTLTTQTRTVTAAPHTLSFYGTGSVSLSGATIGTVIGSGANTRTVYTFTPTAGSLTLTVSGSVTSAQLEQKPFATSYIPTVGGPMTRNADVVSSTISSWFNQTEGTVVVSGDRNNNPTLNASGYDSFFEFTGTAGYLLVHACDGATEGIYDAAGSPVVAVGATIGSLTSIAASYSDTTDFLYISRNGLATQSATSIGLGVAPVTLNIGYSPASSIGNWNGHIKSFRYYPKALPDKLQRLSS